MSLITITVQLSPSFLFLHPSIISFPSCYSSNLCITFLPPPPPPSLRFLCLLLFHPSASSASSSSLRFLCLLLPPSLPPLPLPPLLLSPAAAPSGSEEGHGKSLPCRADGQCQRCEQQYRPRPPAASASCHADGGEVVRGGEEGEERGGGGAGGENLRWRTRRRRQGLERGEEERKRMGGTDLGVHSVYVGTGDETEEENLS
eukprot:767524-Hanusia_phi.AAC.1